MNKLFKKIDNKWYYLGFSDTVNQYDIENNCKNFYVDLSEYDSTNHHIVLHKDIDANYVIEQLPREENIQNILQLYVNKRRIVQLLTNSYNDSKKITIQNGNTLVIAHDTPERGYFITLIEVVSTLSPRLSVEYIQTTDKRGLGFRILSEIAAYIFKDLFTATLTNGIKVNARKRNKTILYNNALEQINNAATQAELDAVTWAFINPTGIVIDVNAKAIQMLADTTVSDFAKDAINAAKDPETGEIHLVQPLSNLI
jgi:hypothetical protein